MDTDLVTEAIRLLRRYAAWLGVSGAIVYGGALGLTYSGVLAPLEVFLFLALGAASFIASIVLFILSLVTAQLPWRR
ncbi:hypothetical protein ACSBOB_02510 [Mesorhizobium sp. ASY16-5R]|uniref:hypothetical protein n=1 Tax=Mesorhizobium sp. ASY16-5R TaxID=3445772 RepID=UPI003F9FB597